MTKFSDNCVSNGDIANLGGNKMLASCPSSEINLLPKQCRYQCEFCQKSFTRPSHLTRHIRIHTGEKPFKCLLCGKGFKQSNHLTSHMKTHDAVRHTTSTITSSLGLAEAFKHGVSTINRCESSSLTPTSSSPLSLSLAPKHQLQRQLAGLPLSTNQSGIIDSIDGVMPRLSSGSVSSSAVAVKGPNNQLLSSNKQVTPACASGSTWQKHPNRLTHRERQECAEKKDNFNSNNFSAKRLLRCELCNKQFISSTFFDIHMQMHSAIHFKTTLPTKANNASEDDNGALPVSSASSVAVTVATAPPRVNLKENMCLQANTIRRLLNKPSPVLNNLQTCLVKDISPPSEVLTVKPDPDVIVIGEVLAQPSKLTPNPEKDISLHSSRLENATHIVCKQGQGTKNKQHFNQNVKWNVELCKFGKKVGSVLSSQEEFLSPELPNESRHEQARFPSSSLGITNTKIPEPNPSRNLTIKQQLSLCTFCNKDFANSTVLAQHVCNHLKNISAGQSYQFSAQAVSLLGNDSSNTTIKIPAFRTSTSTSKERQSLAAPLFPQRESPFQKKPSSVSDLFAVKRRNRHETGFVRKSSLNNRPSVGHFTSASQIKNISKTFSRQTRHFRNLSSFPNSLSGNQLRNQSQGLSRKGQKHFKCKHCVKAFSRPSHLLRHVRIHTGEKPFKCKYCDKRFRQTNHLTSHIKTHTAGRGLSCQHCKKTFSLFGQLNQHIKNVHLAQPLTLKDGLQSSSEIVSDLAINSIKHRETEKSNQSVEEKLKNISLKPSISNLSSCLPVPTSVLPKSQILFNSNQSKTVAQVLPPNDLLFSSLLCTETNMSSIHIDNSEGLLPNFKDSIMVPVSDDTNSLPLNKAIKEELFSDAENSEPYLLPETEPTIADSANDSNDRIQEENKKFSLKSQDPHLQNAQLLLSCSEETLNMNTQELASELKGHTNSLQFVDNQSLANLSLESTLACQKEEEDTTLVFTSHTSDNLDATPVYLIKKSSNQNKYSTYLVSLNESSAPLTKSEPVDDELDPVQRTVDLIEQNSDTAEYSYSTDLARSTSSEHLTGIQKNSCMNDDLTNSISPKDNSGVSLSANPQLQEDIIILATEDEEHKDPLSPKDSQSFVECNKCHQNFSNTLALSRHLALHDQQEPEKNLNVRGSSFTSRDFSSSQTTYECSTCNQLFSDSSNFEIHLKSHMRIPTPCGRRDRIERLNNIHTIPRFKFAKNNYGINKNYFGSQKNSIKQNTGIGKQEIRKGIKSFQFFHRAQISKKSLGASALNRSTVTAVSGLTKTNLPVIPTKQNRLSYRTLTNGRRSCKCSFCEKSFSRPSHLIRHVRIHTGEKPFKCTLCSKSFTQSNHLTSHLKIHMEKVDSLTCQYCQKVFLLPNTFVTHLQMHAVPAPPKLVPKKTSSEKENLATSSTSMPIKTATNSTNHNLFSDNACIPNSNTNVLPSVDSQSSTIRKLLSLGPQAWRPPAKNQRGLESTDHIITLGPRSLTSAHYQSGSDVSKTVQSDRIVSAKMADDLIPENADNRFVSERKEPVKSEQDYSRGLIETSVTKNEIALSLDETLMISDSNKAIHDSDCTDIGYQRNSELVYNKEDVKPKITSVTSVMPSIKNACQTVASNCVTSGVEISEKSATNCAKQRSTIGSSAGIYSFECCGLVFSSIEEFQKHVTSHVNDQVEPDLCNAVSIKTEVL